MVFWRCVPMVGFTDEPLPGQIWVNTSLIRSLPSIPKKTVGWSWMGNRIYRTKSQSIWSWRPRIRDTMCWIVWVESTRLENVLDFSTGLYGPTIYFGWDIARDMELNNTGDGIFLLDGLGGVHPIGNVTEFSEVPYWGFDTAIDLTLTPSGNGYHILSRSGEIVAQGDAVDLAIPDIEATTEDQGFVGLEYTPGTDGYLVMAASGEVTPIVNARIGSDLYLNGQDNNYVDIEVVGLSADNAWNIIAEYFKAYEDENVDRIAALFAEDYLDNHGNDKDEALDSLRQTFEYFMIGTPHRKSNAAGAD